ncbi:LOW QUALITY PROTEIN: negative elongation factor E-like [Liolophura sinensis]|uniref:LOW QUALITY PROTEIN: negative elongation factor E-like n=1 Tax=Liolophura sinensis TaxID=3198878 RepID=UPI0031586827
MVYVNFPVKLTEEEETLQKKYAKLRKKRKSLQAHKTGKQDHQQGNTPPVKRLASEASTEEAKEAAKKLLKSGIIKLKDDSKDKHSFKRSKNFEKKMKDTEKTPTAVGFQPFAAFHQEEDERRDESRPRVKKLYDSFVGSREGRESRDGREGRDSREGRDRRDSRYERDDRREREAPKKGNTIYVHGHGVNEDLLRKAFCNLGTILNISVEKEKNCGFVTFEKMESADQAIAEMNGSMVSGVQMKVSMAFRQPVFEGNTQDPSTSSWASIAASNSQKGTHRDKREMVSYDNDDIF